MPSKTGSGLRQVDPRGIRFAAALTVVVLAVALALESPYVLAVQVAVFALGAALGPARSPYGLLFRGLVRPRLAAPKELEAEAPPRFAQAVGLLFTVPGLIGYLVGASLFASIAVALALIAAFLNAVFGLCLGCEAYLLLLRALRRPTPDTSARGG